MEQKPERAVDGEGGGSFVVFIDDGGGNLEAMTAAHPRAYEVRIGGVGYYHVAEMPTGEWIYRKH